MFKTRSSIILNRFETLNRRLIAQMQGLSSNLRLPGSDSVLTEDLQKPLHAEQSTNLSSTRESSDQSTTIQRKAKKTKKRK